MKLVVFGASGRTGVPLVERALEAGHEVVAFVRDADSLGIENERLEIVEGDAYTGENVVRAVEGADAVASVLGQSSSGPDDLLAVAGRNVMDAMDAAGVERYVTLVGAGVRTEDEPVSLGGRVMGALLKLLSRAVLEDAEAHVADIRERDFAWTVVRVPRLSEDEPRGEYRSGTDLKPGFDAIARADVADFVLDVVENDRYVRELPKVAY